MILCLVIFVLTIASFLWGKISMGLTALLSMVLLVLTGCIDITTALSGFSNSNTIIMACMFIISAGFSKTQMVAKLSRGVAKAAKGSFTRVLTGYIIVTFLIAQIVPSAMAVFSIVFPLALGVCDEMKVSPSKIMFSIGIVAISTVTALPIGAGAVYPAQYNGLLENLGAGAFQFKFWDVGLARLPGVIAVMLYAILLAPKFAPEKPVIETREVKPVGAAGAVKLSPVQEVVGYLVFFGVILGLIVTSLQLIKIPVIGEDGTTTLMKLDTCVFPLIGALLMVDMAHIAGLVAGGQHMNPVPYADVVTTTTHKTLRGPRGGMILSRDEELAKKLNSAVFPGTQGGPLMHVIAGKAICLREAAQPEFRTYAEMVVKNAKALADALLAHGFDLVTGGTDNHLMLADLRKKNITGKELQTKLDEVHITVNKNAIPNDPQKPGVTSGVRIGTPACTTRGFTPEDMPVVADCIDKIATDYEANREAVLAAVAELVRKHPIYE